MSLDKVEGRCIGPGVTALAVAGESTWGGGGGTWGVGTGKLFKNSYLDGDGLFPRIVSLSPLRPNIEELVASAGDRFRELHPWDPVDLL